MRRRSSRSHSAIPPARPCRRGLPPIGTPERPVTCSSFRSAHAVFLIETFIVILAELRSRRTSRKRQYVNSRLQSGRMLAMNTKPQAWLLLSICVLGSGACTSDTAPPESDAAARAALERRIDAAAALTARLKAVQAVKRLQHAYGHYSEVGLWHDFADLFADNAVGHYTQGDLGKEEIRKLFVEQVGQGILGLADGRIYPHIALSPVITL